MEKNNFRNKTIIKSSIIGILCNILLAGLKYIVGTLSKSLSITADAANNLSDAGSNVVTIVGGILSGKPMDKEHPFGHGRMEYISALIVSFLILHMGVDLCKSSIQRIITPQTTGFSLVYVLVPLFSIIVKLGMAIYNKNLYKKTGNINFHAVSQDSLNDCISTATSLASLVLAGFFDIERIDGIAGLVVSIFIIISGIEIVKDVMGPLLGEAPDESITKGIEERILLEKGILGVHDIIVHDYGYGNMIASAHAEMPANLNAVELHDIIDHAEKHIEKDLGIIICIHIDPVKPDDTELEYYKKLVSEIITEYNNSFGLHDFKYINGSIGFELVVPFETDKEQTEVNLKQLFAEKLNKVKVSFLIEHQYV